MVAGLAAVWLALNEVSLLAAGFLAQGGKSWSFNGMSGPLAVREYGDWHGVLIDEQLRDWLPLLGFYLVLDFILIALYVPVLRRFVATGPVLALAALDVAENVMTYWLGTERCAGGDCVSNTQAFILMLITELKWAAFVVVLAALVHRHHETIWAALPRIYRALRIQRFSLLAFLPLALLTVVPGTEVFDQLPDVQRSWLDTGVGVRHALDRRFPVLRGAAARPLPARPPPRRLGRAPSERSILRLALP